MQQKEIKCDNHLKTQVKTTVTKFSTEYALMERLLEMIGQLGIIHSDKNLFAMFDSMVRYINKKNAPTARCRRNCFHVLGCRAKTDMTA